jgi:hypothetical protein
LLENDYSVGSVDDILVAVHVSTKGPHLDTLEKFYILGKKKCNQINDKSTIDPNRIFDVIAQYKTAP